MDQKASPAALNVEENNSSQAPEVIALQPLAVVDHLCSVTEDTLKSVLAQEEIGGSRRISQQQVQDMLAQIGEFHSKAGGSNANTIRGKPAHAHCHILSLSDKHRLAQSWLLNRSSSRLWCPM